ncbi:hypothetical protein [Paenibacillus sp. AD87]|nr:hypothetical protein [Paenibacillus sp. AD87]
MNTKKPQGRERKHGVYPIPVHSACGFLLFYHLMEAGLAAA